MKRRNNFSVFHTQICSRKYLVRGSFEKCKGTNFNDSGMSSYLMLNIFYCNTTKKREQKPNSCFRKKRKKTALQNIFSKFSIPSTVPLIASEIKLHMMKEHLSVSPSGFPQECGWNKRNCTSLRIKEQWQLKVIADDSVHYNGPDLVSTCQPTLLEPLTSQCHFSQLSQEHVLDEALVTCIQNFQTIPSTSSAKKTTTIIYDVKKKHLCNLKVFGP